MSANVLKLNWDKTEILFVGPDNLHPINNPFSISPSSISFSPTVRSLAVLSDTNLTFEKDTNKVTQSCFYRLRIIARIRSMLSFNDTQTITHAFISSQLDNGNGLFIGVN